MKKTYKIISTHFDINETKLNEKSKDGNIKTVSRSRQERNI